MFGFRNFRSSLELELHQNSHAFSKFRDIRRHVKAKSRAEREYLRLLKQAVRLLSLKDAQAKTATKAVETKQKVAKKSVKSKSKKKVQKSRSKTSKPATKPLNTSSRPIPAATDDPFKLKMKVKLKPLDLNALKKGASSRRKSATTPKPVAKVLDQLLNTTAEGVEFKTYFQKPKTPKSTKRRASAGQASTPVVPPAAKISKEDALTCPTCDKTFLAKSIFMRHLKTYKHGIYSSGTDPELSVSTPPAFIPHPTDKQLPHYNQVLQPTMEVGGREVPSAYHHCCCFFLRHSIFRSTNTSAIFATRSSCASRTWLSIEKRPVRPGLGPTEHPSASIAPSLNVPDFHHSFIPRRMASVSSSLCIDTLYFES